MREFVEQPVNSPRLFDLDEITLSFWRDGSLSLSRYGKNDGVYHTFLFRNREELEAFIKLAQTMPFPEEKSHAKVP